MVNSQVFLGLLIPFIGTSAGSLCVYFMKDRLSETMRKLLTGFAAA